MIPYYYTRKRSAVRIVRQYVLRGSAVSQDTYINKALADSNFAGGARISVGRVVSDDHVLRGLLRFDLSEIPADALVTGAYLRLWCTVAIPGSSIVSAHRSLVEWYEGPTGDRSTWNHRNANGSVAWEGGAGGAAGDDWVAQATDSLSIPVQDAFYVWNVTDDVAAWHEGSADNYGWWLLSSNESTDNICEFVQSEQTAGGGPPVLTVTCVME